MCIYIYIYIYIYDLALNNLQGLIYNKAHPINITLNHKVLYKLLVKTLWRVQNLINSPKETYFIHVKILEYEDPTVSILADHNLY